MRPRHHLATAGLALTLTGALAGSLAPAQAIPAPAVAAAAATSYDTRQTDAADTPATSGRRTTTMQLQSGTRWSDGRTRVRLTVTWRSSRVAVVRGRLNDLCPGDDTAAYLRLVALRTGGGPGPADWTKVDDRGCEADALKFQKKLVARERLRGVRVQVAKQWNTTVVTDRRNRDLVNPR